MFNKGDYIVYGAHGVCRVADLVEEREDGRPRTYYALTPNDFPARRILIPADNPLLLARIHKVFSKEELMALLTGLDDDARTWSADSRERQKEYAAVFEQGDRRELLQLIRMLYLKREELSRHGKKLWAVDENALKRAEKLINEEFSVVLEIPPAEVPEFIRGVLQPAG